ncbi:MAG: cob(I)yrinic acid a,c-diamide adenosyltransferase [Saprospirales bacterium]|nr:MAG: cob(I)yrinic acid a,c-diamide adenosyltransferase [Saprospirales bacterium]
MSFKIYTRGGDKGKTSLFGGKRVLKDHDRIEAYGTVDELNSFTGLLRDLLAEGEFRMQLYRIQNKLFDLGSYLATPDANEREQQVPKIKQEDIDWLEKCIDEIDGELKPLANFILPGGDQRVSQAHICRTICRRAERRVVTLGHEVQIDPIAVKFLNRLSDYFFILGRGIAHQYQIEEIQWEKDS